MQLKPKKSLLYILKEVWPKILIFLVMTSFTIYKVYQNIQTSSKGMDFHQEYNFRISDKIIFTIVMFGILIFLVYKNDKYEKEQEELKLLEEDKQKYQGVETFQTKKFQQKEKINKKKQ
ncbi:hypothetical protein pb186bvf_015958 [Paramecium bursaria]